MDTTFTAPVDGYATHTLGSFSDDILLLSGSLSPVLSSAGVNASTGFFGTGAFIKYFDFSLTTAGEDFFTDPTPFYSQLSFDGQYNVAGYTGTVSNNGSADLKFLAAVPEPSGCLAVILGAALLAAQRRRKLSLH